MVRMEYKMTEDTLKRLRDLEKTVAVLQANNKTLGAKLDNLSGGINRGLWLIGGGIISVVVAWVMAGGFIAK
jgi:hypothetical protein